MTVCDLGEKLNQLSVIVQEGSHDSSCNQYNIISRIVRNMDQEFLIFLKSQPLLKQQMLWNDLFSLVAWDGFEGEEFSDFFRNLFEEQVFERASDCQILNGRNITFFLGYLSTSFNFKYCRSFTLSLAVRITDSTTVEMTGQYVSLSLNALAKFPNLWEPEILNAVIELSSRIVKMPDLELTGQAVAISLNSLSKFTDYNEPLISKAVIILAERIDSQLEMNSQNISNALSGLSKATDPSLSSIQQAIGQLIARIVVDLPMNGQDISNCLNSIVRIHERCFGECRRRNPLLFGCFLELAHKIVTNHRRLIMNGQEVSITLVALSKFEVCGKEVVVDAFMEMIKRVPYLDFNGQETAISLSAISQFRDLYTHPLVKKALFKFKTLITRGPAIELDLNGQGICMSLIAFSRMNVRHHLEVVERLAQLITPDLYMTGVEISNSLNSLSRMHPENQILQSTFIQLAEKIHPGVEMTEQHISMSLNVFCKAKNVMHSSIRSAIIELAERVSSKSLTFKNSQGISNCILSLGKLVEKIDHPAIFNGISRLAGTIHSMMTLSGLDVSSILQGICWYHEIRNDDEPTVNHAINVMANRLVTDRRLVNQMTGTNVAFSLKALGSIVSSTFLNSSIIKEAISVLANQIHNQRVNLSNLEMDIAMKALALV